MSLYDMLFKSRAERGKKYAAEAAKPKAPTAGAPKVKKKKRKARAIGDVISGKGRAAFIDNATKRMTRGR